MAQLSQIIGTHKESSRHRDAIFQAGVASCFYCFWNIGPNQIQEWVDNGTTAICPFCGIDAVLPGNYDVLFLEEMKRYWFGDATSTRISMKNGTLRKVTDIEIHEDPELKLGDLQRDAHENSANKGFWDDVDGQKPDVGAKLMLIVSEVSEAMEEYRTGKPLDHTYLVDGKPEGFGVELADAMIRIADLAEYAKVDLSSLIRLKMRFNLTRPKMHGKKV